MRIHLIASKVLTELGASSRFNAERNSLCRLRDKGRRAAEAFLTANGKTIGKQCSIDLEISFRGWSVLLLAPAVAIVAAPIRTRRSLTRQYQRSIDRLLLG